MDTDWPVNGWARRATFEHFQRFAQPFFGVCVRLDVSALVACRAQLPGGVTLALYHLALQLANAPAHECWRLRIRAGRVWRVARVDGSMAVLRDDDSIGFADFDHQDSHAAVCAAARPVIEAVRSGRAPFDASVDRDALLHFTTLPWLDFTSFSNPRDARAGDSVPKLAFGQFVEEPAGSGRWRMALAIEVHHGLMDGVHVGRFVEDLQERLREPMAFLAG